MNIDDLSQIVKNASREVWQNNIANDYKKGRLRREASLQSSFYYHLRNKIGDSTLDFYNASLYTEYHYKGKRVDLAVVIVDENELAYPIAIFEFKYKSMISDIPFLKDVEKIIQYIDKDESCVFYLGFIQEVEFSDLSDDFSWLNETQIEKAGSRLIEMTGGIYRPNEEPVWSFKEVKNIISQTTT